jgi:hypothetical protein
LSSSWPEFSLAWFIATSLEALHAECPAAYALLCAQLAPRRARLTVDGETVMLTFEAGAVRVLTRARNPAVQLVTTRRTILDVIDARLTLQEAVLAEAILLKGRPNDLAAFHEGLIMYVRGAVRCPAFPPLLDRFRYEQMRESEDAD